MSGFWDAITGVIFQGVQTGGTLVTADRYVWQSYLVTWVSGLGGCFDSVSVS